MQKYQALQLIADKIATCTKCTELSNYRESNNYKTVPGEGNAAARFLFIGEAPGQNEAETGRPFVGRAGKLLDSLIKQVGLNRESVFIANSLKCRPPANRDPSRTEACNCSPFLKLQIAVIQPEYIVCVGRVAALNLLKPDTIDDKVWFSKSLASMRGMLHSYEGIKTICSYHPSYLLRNPSAEKFFIEDLKNIIKD